MTSPTPPAESRDAEDPRAQLFQELRKAIAMASQGEPGWYGILSRATGHIVDLIDARIAEALAKLSSKPAAPSPCKECGRTGCPFDAAERPKPPAEAKAEYPERLKLLQTPSKWEGVPCVEQRIFDMDSAVAGAVVYVRADVAACDKWMVEYREAIGATGVESMWEAIQRVMRDLATEKLRAEAADNAERRAIYAETELAETKRKLEEAERAATKAHREWCAKYDDVETQNNGLRAELVRSVDEEEKR